MRSRLKALARSCVEGQEPCPPLVGGKVQSEPQCPLTVTCPGILGTATLFSTVLVRNGGSQEPPFGLHLCTRGRVRAGVKVTLTPRRC